MFFFFLHTQEVFFCVSFRSSPLCNNCMYGRRPYIVCIMVEIVVCVSGPGFRPFVTDVNDFEDTFCLGIVPFKIDDYQGTVIRFLLMLWTRLAGIIWRFRHWWSSWWITASGSLSSLIWQIENEMARLSVSFTRFYVVLKIIVRNWTFFNNIFPNCGT